VQGVEMNEDKQTAAGKSFQVLGEAYI